MIVGRIDNDFMTIDYIIWILVVVTSGTALVAKFNLVLFLRNAGTRVQTIEQ